MSMTLYSCIVLTVTMLFFRLFGVSEVPYGIIFSPMVIYVIGYAIYKVLYIVILDKVLTDIEDAAGVTGKEVKTYKISSLDELQDVFDEIASISSDLYKKDEEE